MWAPVTDHPAQASSGLCKINTVCNTWPHRGRTPSRTQASRGPTTEIQCLEPGQARPEVNQTREDQSHRTDLTACCSAMGTQATDPPHPHPRCHSAERQEEGRGSLGNIIWRNNRSYCTGRSLWNGLKAFASISAQWTVKIGSTLYKVETAVFSARLGCGVDQLWTLGQMEKVLH